MDDTSLDTLLTRADPAAAHDDGLDPLLHELAAAAETAAGRRRRTTRRAGLAGALAVAILGGAGVGSATGIFSLAPTPSTGDWMSEPGTRVWTVGLATGEACEITLTVLPEEAAGERLGVDAEEWRTTLEAAQEALSGVDVASIDVDAAAQRYRVEAEETRRRLVAGGMPRSELAPRESGDYLRASATVAEIWDRVSSELRAAGLRPEVLQTGWSHACPGLDPDLGGRP